MASALKVIRASDIPPRGTRVSTEPLQDARVANAVRAQTSAAARLQQAQAELGKRRTALADAQQARRSAIASGRSYAVDLDALARAEAEQAALVADVEAIAQDADRRLKAAREVAPGDEETAALEAEIESAIGAYAAWIDTGAELHRDLEALRARANARLGAPTGLDFDLKTALSHASSAHDRLREAAASSAFARASWRSHVG